MGGSVRFSSELANSKLDKVITDGHKLLTYLKHIVLDRSLKHIVLDRSSVACRMKGNFFSSCFLFCIIQCQGKNIFLNQFRSQWWSQFIA